MRNGAVRAEKIASAAATEGLTREVMDIRQAAAYLGISTDSLYRYASEATIPGFRLGNRWRFKKSRLDSWMEEQSGGATTKGKAARIQGKKPVRAAHGSG